MNTAAELPLRDIHLPEAVSWWPPGPGWWILAGLILASCFALFWLWRRYQQGATRRYAIGELNRLATEYEQTQNAQDLITALSSLLRRASLCFCSRQKVAALTGPTWLQWLDQHSHTKEFSQGVGTVLLSGPYANQSSYDAAALLNLCRQFLQQIPNKKSGAEQ